jgi:hypothetical protein
MLPSGINPYFDFEVRTRQIISLSYLILMIFRVAQKLKDPRLELFPGPG